MLDSVSPYALLKQSKPKPVPSYVTAYDLFSTASQCAAPDTLSDRVPSPSSAAEASALQVRQAAQLPPSFGAPAKTHYIADIKKRHSRAAGRAQMRSPDSAPQTPPSVQTPPA